jgi:diguanylate cyclase (GGDEF)-like protein
MERVQKKSQIGWLDKICRRYLDSGVERDARRQEMIIAILMLTGSVVITGLSLWDMFEGAGVYWGNQITLAIGLLAIASYILMLVTSKASLSITLVLMVFLHFFSLVTSGTEITGMFWCLVMLPLFFYLLGHKQGGVLVVIVFLASTVVLLYPDLLALPKNYSAHTSYRFLLAYLVLFWISLLVENVRFQTRQRLEEVSNNFNLQARTDELTGLANRRGFKQYLGETEQRSGKGRESFAVMVGDLDHFKQINDEYGHEVGDLVLREVAKTLKTLVRSEDLIVRWGGEEFLLLLVGTDLKGAQILAEKIRHKVASTHFSTKAGKISVSMSLGVDAQKVGADLYATLGSADRAMYEAKKRGRNCVVCAEDSDKLDFNQVELELPVKAGDEQPIVVN